MADPPPKAVPPPASRDVASRDGASREDALRAALPAARSQFRALLAVLAGPRRG